MGDLCSTQPHDTVTSQSHTSNMTATSSLLLLLVVGSVRSLSPPPVHNDFQYPSTQGAAPLCLADTCSMEVSVKAQYDLTREPDFDGVAPVIEGIFGMIISKAERMGSMYNGTSHPGQSHFVIEIENDPFKCGKHPVEVYQSIQTGELTEFKFHKEEQELSSRYKQGMITAVAIYYENKQETKQHKAGFSFVEGRARHLRGGDVHRKWNLEVESVTRWGTINGTDITVTGTVDEAGHHAVEEHHITAPVLPAPM